MSGELVAIGLVFLVHVAGAAFLVWAIMGGDDLRGLRGWWPREDGDGGSPRAPEPGAGPGGLPLPTSGSSPVRLRERGRLGAAHPRGRRRPGHPPAPAREPQRR